MYYALKGREVVPSSLTEMRITRVALDSLEGGAVVSTVFLGIDHGHGGERPLLFETMVFGLGEADAFEPQWRCSTYDEAEAQHKEAVRLVRATMIQRMIKPD